MKFNLRAFLAKHPVFGLDELVSAYGSSKRAARGLIGRRLADGRIKSVARGIYAVVPPGLDSETFEPDPFLVGAAARPNGVFAFHSALELLGVSHSLWFRQTMHCDHRRSTIETGRQRIDFLATPEAIRRSGSQWLATQLAMALGRRVRTTGPERTLVECLRRPDQAGGIGEAVESLRGLALLDFAVLREVLDIYDEARLWSACGWLTNANREAWFTPETFLEECQERGLHSNGYLVPGSRGGGLVAEWRLIVPSYLTGGFETSAADG